MFEGSGRLVAAVTFSGLAEAIADIPLRPERGCAANPAEEARALMLLRRQLDARLLTRIAAVDEQGLAAADGFGSTAAWVRAATNLDGGPAGGFVAAARLAERLPAMAGAMAEGKIGVEHLQALAAATAQVPPAELLKSDGTLALLALHAHPSDLRQAGKAIAARVDAESVARDAGYAHAARRVTLGRTFGDCYHLEGILEPEAGAALVAALEPLMAKRDREDERTPAQRRADALVELTGLALRAGTLPDCGGDRPRLTFLVRADAPDPLAGPAGAGGLVGASAFSGDKVRLLLGSKALLPWETINRLSCDADLSVATVNDVGEVLNYGRTRRFPTPAQRRAVVLRDQRCVFPECDRLPASCQVHHLIEWLPIGPTDLDNLFLLCHFHHHLVHEGGWRLERLPPGLCSDDNPTGAPGWLATAPDGRQLREFRHPAV